MTEAPRDINTQPGVMQHEQMATPGLDIEFRALQPADAPAVAELWRAGLSQTTKSQTNPCCWCFMGLMMKKMARDAFTRNGDMGPGGCNLAARWDSGESPSACKMMLVAIDSSSDATASGGGSAIVGCCGVKRGTSEKEDVEDAKATDVFSIWRLSVSEKARGCGLGRRLMDACEAWAIEHGGRKMELYTGNPAASKFYIKLGYTKTSTFAHKKNLQ